MNPEYFIRLDCERSKTFTKDGIPFKAKPGRLFLVHTYHGFPRCPELDDEYLRLSLFGRVELGDGYKDYISQLQDEDVPKVDKLVARYPCDSVHHISAMRDMIRFCKAMGVPVHLEADDEFGCVVTFGN